MTASFPADPAHNNGFAQCDETKMNLQKLFIDHVIGFPFVEVQLQLLPALLLNLVEALSGYAEE